MGISLIRFQKNGLTPTWGYLHQERVFSLAITANQLSELLLKGVHEQIRNTLGSGQNFSLEEITFLSPVTSPCQIVCQGKNYLDHIIETGVKPKDKDFNILFSKADSALASPQADLHRPQGVRLLDYEIELGLVMGKDLSVSTKITPENIHEYVVGLTICNDVSARDVQVPQRQWFKGKSFRGFCPVGPVLYLWDKEEVAQLLDLDLHLQVNGKTRQKANTKQLMHDPYATLSEISGIFTLRAGDLLLTGTPGGVAMKVKPKGRIQELLDTFKSDKQKFAEFVEEQAQSPRYLKNGDLIESSIKSANGQIDLGMQKIRVVG